jgi:hypothetical protein
LAAALFSCPRGYAVDSASPPTQDIVKETDEAIENLHCVSSGGDRRYDFEYGAIVTLQMLKDPKALPVLGPLAGHADPLLSRLAREAIADIKRNP